MELVVRQRVNIPRVSAFGTLFVNNWPTQKGGFRDHGRSVVVKCPHATKNQRRNGQRF